MTPDKPKAHQNDLLSQHLRILQNEAVSHDKGEQQRLSQINPKSLKMSRFKYQQLTVGLALAAGVLLTLPMLFSSWESPQTDLIAKGAYGVSIYWQRNEMVKKFAPDHFPLKENDKIRVEITSGKSSHAYLGIYRWDGRRLNSQSSLAKSHVHLDPGGIEKMPNAFALTGVSEGEFVAVFFCKDQMGPSDLKLTKKLSVNAGQNSNYEPISMGNNQCVIRKTILR
ncbi:MAG: hypothetical protein HRU19_08650 [Pseudobacteriovorax sp.]|nr:hypothetical protein [Pseudobacteriovorax sp.]